MKITDKKDHYNLLPSIEQNLVLHACTNPRFYGTVGIYADVDCIKDPIGQQTVKALNELVRDSGRPPTSYLSVIQRLKMWVSDGKITGQDVLQSVEYLEEAEENAMSVEDVKVAVCPVIKKRMKQELALKSTELYQRGDAAFEEMRDMISRIDRVGTSEGTLGTILDENVLLDIAGLKAYARLPFGVPELDAALDGGLMRGCQAVILGGYKSGKSTALIHVSSTALFQPIFCAYASLELSAAHVHAKHISNLTGILTNRILEDYDTAKEAMARYKQLELPGRVVVNYFTPDATTTEDIINWVAEVEEKYQRKVDALFVDYADRVGAKRAGKKEVEAASTYKTGTTVFEAFRHYAHDKGKWFFTAAQAKRKDKKSKQKYLDGDDVADSIGKTRVTDLMVSINPTEEAEDELDPLTEANTYFIAANRHGADRRAIGPIPRDYARSRLISTGNGPRDH